MVVERCVVEMVLERGETRHDVVVNGLKEIALCSKVMLGAVFRPQALQTARRRADMHQWISMLAGGHRGHIFGIRALSA